MTHRAVPNADPRKDLRVITAPDGRILSDQRNKSFNSSKITLPSQQQPTPQSLSSPTTPSYQKSSSVPRVPKPRQLVRGPKPDY